IILPVYSFRSFFCPPSKHPKSFFRSAILLFVHSSRPPFFPSPILTVRKPKLFCRLRSSRPLHFRRPTSIVYEPKPPFEKKKTENFKFLHRKCQSFGRLLYRKTQSLDDVAMVFERVKTGGERLKKLN
uniref:Uncharacterized protein n=1 Tax=Cucumis melo TaxID=3656 RepID=A0A9I9D3K9_CUCME